MFTQDRFEVGDHEYYGNWIFNLIRLLLACGYVVALLCSGPHDQLSADVFSVCPIHMLIRQYVDMFVVHQLSGPHDKTAPIVVGSTSE